MKTMTTAALLAGIVAAPSFAHEVEDGSEVRGMDVAEKANPQHEAFKKFVNDALEAHKGKAPKGMKGHQDEMKAYVGRALDAQQVREKEYAEDVSGNTLKYDVETVVTGRGSLEYVSLRQFESLLENYPCFKNFPDDGTDVSTMQTCISNFFVQYGVTTIEDITSLYSDDLNRNCTGNHWWNGENGSCNDANFRQACIIVANSLWAQNWVLNCKAAGPTIDINRK